MSGKTNGEEQIEYSNIPYMSFGVSLRFYHFKYVPTTNCAHKQCVSA